MTWITLALWFSAQSFDSGDPCSSYVETAYTADLDACTSIERVGFTDHDVWLSTVQCYANGIDTE